MANELLELGIPPQINAGILRKPFLSNAHRLGQGLGDIGGFLVGILQTGFSLLADIIGAPLRLLGEGIGWVFDEIGNIVGEIPILGSLIASILVVTGAVIRFGLSLPEMGLQAISDIFGKLKELFNDEFTESERSDLIKSAKSQILTETPDDLKDTVRQTLQAPGEKIEEVSEEGMNILSVVLPVGVAGVALAVLL